jgi:uncharacterized membrane protein YbhN (UPF0104 family)
MISQMITFSQALLYASATILTQLVGIAPGGIGIRESIVAAVSALLGFDPGAAIIAVGLDRIISSTVILLVGWASILILGKQLTGLPSNPEQ